MLRLLTAAAIFAAVAFFLVVHRAVLTGLFAIRLVCRKSRRANHCRQNRKQHFRVILHRYYFERAHPVVPARNARFVPFDCFEQQELRHDHQLLMHQSLRHVIGSPAK